MKLEEKLIQILMNRENLIRDLTLVRDLCLPNSCIAAGYVRNYIWDYLHNFSNTTPLNDVDVLYFDPSDCSVETETTHERCLNDLCPAYNWSVKNQARMHLRNKDKPYSSVEDAMRRWPETATSIGISLNNGDAIEVIAPYGLDDLFNMKIRISPHLKDRNHFMERYVSKQWLLKWPMLRVIEI